ncbi:phosphate ABC transporter permease subunit PstC [Acidithiobacillus thiooxidans]|uniref:phosphate ABC transporter permease subunit PstC n=1 Tax=Acidithiobacillus thiooxidans TaxID=930 RepID=UPI000A493B47|nr:phosphate ABC transporter permease subunit PstC [Acidithiobacillus thiooxidans]
MAIDDSSFSSSGISDDDSSRYAHSRLLHLSFFARYGDKGFRWLTGALAIFVLFLLLGVAVSLLIRGWEAFHHFGPAFFWSDAWDPVKENFGALIPIYGTVVSSLIALLIAVPVSFGIALFISELAPKWLRQPIGSAIELLAAIPSIIFGMWGLFVFAPVFALAEPWMNDHLGVLPGIGGLFRGPPMGIGMLAAGIILGIMVIPFISAIMRDVFLQVPAMLKESAYGVGATTWEVTRSVVLPYTRTAVVGGIFLGLGRALGETIAVTFVIGNAHDLHLSLLEAGNSIAAALANEFAEAFSPMYKSALMALGFILFIITFVVLVMAKLMLWHLGKGQSKVGL